MDQERAWAAAEAKDWFVQDGEPSHGWTDMQARSGRYGSVDAQVAMAEPDADGEPSLGSLDKAISQAGWGRPSFQNWHPNWHRTGRNGAGKDGQPPALLPLKVPDLQHEMELSGTGRYSLKRI